MALARLAATAAANTPGVVRLDGGPLGAFATYGEGTKVVGVRARGDPSPWVEVRMVVLFGESVPEVADRVRSAVAVAVNEGLPGTDPEIDVHVTEIGTGAGGPAEALG